MTDRSDLERAPTELSPPPGASPSERLQAAAAADDAAVMPEEARRAMEDPSRRLGDRYVLLDELGRGGMAVVHRGWDTALHRPVAIKMILPGGGSRAQEVARLLREARAAAKLRHPAIVPVHEIDEHDGRPYLVMDFVDGVTLDQAVEQVPPSPRRLAAVVRGVAQALHHAHEAGIIHRDVKPQNVIIDRDGRPHLTDFGLARDFGQDRALTVTGQLLGTPGYVAPEQARGDREGTGPLADVYGLGGILYHVLLGRPPFTGATIIEVVTKVFRSDPDLPRRIDPKIHVDLETIAMRCLEKEPARRYRSAREVAEELERFIDGQAILARPIGRRERMWRWARSHRALAGAVGSAAVVAAVSAVAAVVFGVWSFAAIRHQRDLARGETARAVAAEADARSAADREASARSEVEAGSRAKDLLLARALRERAERLGGLGRLAEAAALYAESARVTDGVEARWGLERALAGAGRSVWVSGRGLEARAVAASPDGRLLALGTASGVTRIFDLATGRELRSVAGHQRAVSAVAFDEEGGRLATASHDGAVIVWDATTGERLAEGRGHVSRVVAVAWDGRGRLVSADAAGMLLRWDAATGARLGEHRADAPSPESSPPTGLVGLAGGRVVLGSERGLLGWDDGAAAPEVIDAGAVAAIAVGADGRRVAIASPTGAVRVREREGDGAPRTVGDVGRPVVGVAFVGGGEALIVVGADGSVDELPVDGGPARSIASSVDAGVVLAAALTRDDEIVRVFADGAVDLLARRDGAARPGPVGHTAEVVALGWSRDGATLASGAGDGGVIVWRAEDGELLARFAGPAGGVAALAVLDGGRAVAVSGLDGSLWSWAVGSAAPRWSFDLRHAAVRIGASPDGALLAAVTGPEVLIIDAAGGDVVAPLDLTEVGGAIDVAFSTDGTQLITSGAVGLRAWDVASGRPLWTADGGGDRIAVAPDGRRIVTVGPEGSFFWDAATGRQLVTSQIGEMILMPDEAPDGASGVPEERDLDPWRLGLEPDEDAPDLGSEEGPPPVGRGGLIVLPTVPRVTVALDGHGRRIGSLMRGGGLLVHDARRYRRIAAVTDPAGPIAAFELAPGGRRVATGSAGGDVHVWELPGDEGAPMIAPTGALAIAFDPSGERLVAAEAYGIRMHERGTGDLGTAVATSRVEDPPRQAALAVSPEGRRLLVAENHIEQLMEPPFERVLRGDLRIRSLPDGASVALLSGHRAAVLDVAWSADGALVASAGRDGGARVWNVARGEEVDRVEIASGATAVAFAPEGRILLVGGADGALRLWDDGEVKVIPEAHEGPVSVVAWSRDGRSFVTAGRDGIVSRWDAGGARVDRLVRPGPVSGVGFVAEDRIIVADADGRIAVWATEQDRIVTIVSGERVVRGAGLKYLPIRFAVSRDGARAAVVRAGGNLIDVWDIDEGAGAEPADELVDRVWRATGFRVQALDALPIFRELGSRER